jgi:polyisoprenoid-binding protein YceI
MKKIIILAVITGCSFYASAQKYFTKNGKVSLFSKAPLENIQADNNQVTSTLNTQTGELQFSLLNTAFHFEKALMEEHFNEDYIESAKYPRSTFKGTISNISTVNVDKDGDYKVTVTGDLTMHGKTNSITANGTVTVKAGKVSATSVLNISLKDYSIDLPASVRNNISETIQLTISCGYEKRS